MTTHFPVTKYAELNADALIYELFGRTCCLHLQSVNIYQNTLVHFIR